MAKKNLFKKTLKSQEKKSHTESSGFGVIRFNGNEFAVNLDWYPLETEKAGILNMNYTKEAILKGRSYSVKDKATSVHNADFYCVAPHIKMYAIGDQTKGHKKGIPAFASIISEAVTEDVSWICLFEVETIGKVAYYVASANEQGQILSDNIYNTLDEAQIEFSGMLDGSWHNVFISPDLSNVYEEKINSDILIPINISDILLDTLKGSYTPVKLKPISMKDTFRLYGIIGICLVSVYLGYSYYESYQSEQERIRIQAEQKRLNEAKVIDDQKTTIADPWVNKPVAYDAVVECYKHYVAFKNTFIPGWYMGALRCEDDLAIVTYQRQGGTLNWIRSYVKQNLNGASVSVRELNSVEISVKMKVNYMVNGFPMYSNDAVREYIDSFFDEYSIPVNFTNAVHAGTHNLFNFKTVVVNPLTILPITSKIPGLYLKEMKISGNSNWSLSFENYEKMQGTTVGRRKTG